jgi:HPt (histidine-containing phosphotransfer) domain-containing protein
MTAHAMKGDRELCLAAGMDDYISKPIRSEQLFATLQRVLGAKIDATSPDLMKVDGQGVDLRAALHSVDGDHALLTDIIQAFLEETPGILRTVRTAIREGNVERLERGAHTLKGTLRTLGAPAAAEVAQELELMGRHQGTVGAEEVLDRLERTVDQVSQVLSDYVRSQLTAAAHSGADS